MSKETTATVVWVLGLAILATTLAYADPTAPTSLDIIGSESRDLGSLSAQSVDAQGGNVTEVNINALTITKSWQGYYGQITGEITLDDASENTFYNWSATSVDGEVYATRASSVSWASVNCTNATKIAAEETYLGQAAVDGDSVSNTYTLNTHPAFNVSSVSITENSCFSTYGYVNNQSQSSDWVQVLLTDLSGDSLIYSTLINDGATGFNGQAYDFQLLVGENEHSGAEGVTPYYFFVELN